AIANDQAYKRRQDALKESRRDCLDLEASILRFRAEKRQFFNGNKPLGSSSSITGPGSPSSNSVAPAPVFDAQSKPMSLTFLDNTSRGQRRLSHPAELELKKSPSEGRSKLSLNPIYRQVPRVLREDFDIGVDVQLDEEHSVHDVAALLKEFLRDMPDPLLPRELYPAFMHSNLLRGADQLQYLQHLLYLLPPCNCDTLLRLLSMLQTVQSYAQDTIGTNDEEVSAELQQEVLMSLIQTDPDVIDYLLRRKLSVMANVCEGRSAKSIRHMRQFHSHHNLLSLSQPSPLSRLHSQDGEPQDRRGAPGPAMSFTLGSGSAGSRGSCSSLSGSTENSIWVRQMQQEEGKSSPAANFWDFFTGKGSSSETVV
ncbi:hypothetical protein XENOCAPTIV_027839, partial [Xenoophorus captivus]